SLIALWRQRRHLAIWNARDRAALLGSRDSLAMALTALSVSWWLIVVVETAAGYPGLQRFFFPATATVCVLSGLGFVELVAVVARMAGDALGARRGAGGGAGARRAVSIVAIGAAAVLSVASYPFISRRLAFARVQDTQVEIERAQMNELRVAIAALGGTKALL